MTHLSDDAREGEDHENREQDTKHAKTLWFLKLRNCVVLYNFVRKSIISGDVQSTAPMNFRRTLPSLSMM